MEEKFKKIENIYTTTLEIFDLADKENITTHQGVFIIVHVRLILVKKNKITKANQ